MRKAYVRNFPMKSWDKARHEGPKAEDWVDQMRVFLT